MVIFVSMLASVHEKAIGNSAEFRLEEALDVVHIVLVDPTGLIPLEAVHTCERRFHKNNLARGYFSDCEGAYSRNQYLHF